MLGGFGDLRMALLPSERRAPIIFVLLVLALVMTVHVSAQLSASPALSTAPATPVHLTAEQDRLRLLGLLGLTESDLRPAPVPDAHSPKATNYDETKADVYARLPDPLVFNDGHKLALTEGQKLGLKSGHSWFSVDAWDARRKEIKADFDHEILGRTPPNLPGVHWEVVSDKPELYGGVAVKTKRLAGHVDNSSYPQIKVDIDLLLITPAHSSGPVPVILELAFDKDFQLAVSGPLDNYVPTPWGVDGKLALQRGWGFAILNPVSYQKDDGSGLTDGIIGLMNKGQPRSLNDWGVLKAWAWGAGRALAYLQSDKNVNGFEIGLSGHSRFGKAVLVTMAYYPGFAVGYSSSSGEGGAKLYRHIYGEQIPNLASASLYHWLAGNFLRYAGRKNAGDLPVDNHELIALCAPRPLFIGGGADGGDGYANPNGDAWADPRGMFLAEVAAGSVYRLLGAKDLGTTQFPPAGTAVMTGELAFRQHNGGHTPAPNWPYFLEFAGRYLHAPKEGAH
jgi:hypothetical protein